MTELASTFPQAFSLLSSRLQQGLAKAEDLALPLRALQRMGLDAADLRVHLERIRAFNDAGESDETLEENALLALDLISGVAHDAGLSWLPADRAQVGLPRVLTLDLLRGAVAFALAPSSILPPRPGWDVSPEFVEQRAIELYDQLSNYQWKPQRADFFRAPKAGMTSRPAALLAPQDRIIYEALVEPIGPLVDARLPVEVTWPRSRESRAPHSDYARRPASWRSRYVVSTDIESFYDSVDHAILANSLGAEVRASHAYSDTLEAFLDAVMGSSSGLPQGPAGSELLATAYLLPIDSNMKRAGWRYARYADDILIAADSVIEGRLKLEELEEWLRPLNLRLNSSKTRILRSGTYLIYLDRPSRRVQELRARIRTLLETQQRGSVTSEQVDALLRRGGAAARRNSPYGAGDTSEKVETDITPVPPLLDAYAAYFEQVGTGLASGSIPSNLEDAERDLRECLTNMAAGARSTHFGNIIVVLRWIPRLAPDIAEYLIAMADDETEQVSSLVESILQRSNDIDWVTAWLCYVAETSPQIVTPSMVRTLRDTARNERVGELTRSSAVRSLANAGQLDERTWSDLYSTSRPAMRAELYLTSQGAPEGRYPPAMTNPILPAIES